MQASGTANGREPARFFVLMGVCGVGKTTVATAVAEALGAAFVEADDFHSPENVSSMAGGVALSDEQRWPWLRAVCDEARRAGQASGAVVIACSALKKSYRDFIRRALGAPVFIHLHGEKELIRTRLETRAAHFMPSRMLDSQLADLESPVGEADTFSVDVSRPKRLVADESISICRQYVAAVDRTAVPRTGKAEATDIQS